MPDLFLNEHRCVCGKLLFKGIFFDGTLEIKCKKCGTINKVGQIKITGDKSHYILMIDSNGIISNISNSACDILGYTSNELIGKHFTQINPSVPKEIGKKFLGPKSALNENNYFRIETFHQSKDGKKFPVVILLKLYQPTKKERYLLVSVKLKNKTDNKKTSEFFVNACDFYFEIDRDGIIEYISPQIKKLFGFSQKKVIGKNCFDFIPAKTRTRSKKIFKHFSANEQPYRVAHDVGKDARGKIMHNELYFTPKFNDYCKFCGYRVLGWVIKKANHKSVDNS